MSKSLNILLCGVGGQGTVLASKLIAKCAMSSGKTAHTAETIGMAQRGGCVVSHVRIGSEVYAPLISKGQADVIIAFEPAEAVRNISYLKNGGNIVVSSSAVKPVTDALSSSNYNADEMLEYLKNQDVKLTVLDGKKVVNECGSAKVLNIALLAAAAKLGIIGVSSSELISVIKTGMKPKFLQMNLKAVTLGESFVK